MSELCTTGGLRLRKFVLNNSDVLESIPLSEQATNVKDMDLAFDDMPLESALGIQWDVESECFKFSVNLKEQPAIRCGILSTVASLYDPLGLVAPVQLQEKIILLEMCRHGTG